MSNHLKEQRIEVGCKMRELAIKAGVSASMLSDIERYNYQPREVTKEKIAEALGVEVSRIWPSTPATANK